MAAAMVARVGEEARAEERALATVAVAEPEVRVHREAEKGLVAGKVVGLAMVVELVVA